MWRQPSVHAEHPPSHHCSNGQEFERIGDCFPQADSKLALALIVEAVDLVELTAFMISAEEEEVEGILDLVGHEQAKALKGLFAAINIVPQEEIAALSWLAHLLEDVQQVLELPVDVSANHNWGIQLEQHRLADQHCPAQIAQTFHLILTQGEVVPDAPLCPPKPQDYVIEIQVPLHPSFQ